MALAKREQAAPAPAQKTLSSDAWPHYILDDHVGFWLRRAQQRHLAIFAALMAEGLTPQQFAALAKLAELGPQSHNALGRHTAMDNATINGVVTRLRKRGLVETFRSAEDRRLSMLRLTAKGKEVFQTVAPLAEEITRRTLAPLSEREQKTLLRLLRKIG